MKEKIYKIEVQEFLSRIIEIKALTAKSAREKAEEMYRNQQIVLDDGDFVCKHIKLSTE